MKNCTLSKPISIFISISAIESAWIWCMGIFNTVYLEVFYLSAIAMHLFPYRCKCVIISLKAVSMSSLICLWYYVISSLQHICTWNTSIVRRFMWNRFRLHSVLWNYNVLKIPWLYHLVISTLDMVKFQVFISFCTLIYRRRSLYYFSLVVITHRNVYVSLSKITVGFNYKIRYPLNYD